MIVLTNAWTGLPMAFNVDQIVSFTPPAPPTDDKGEVGSEYGPKCKVKLYILSNGMDDGGTAVAEDFETVYERLSQL